MISGGYGIVESEFGGLRVWKMHMKSAQSSFRDRTQEFRSVAERLKKSFSSAPGANGPSSSRSKSEEQRSAIAIQSEFNKRASKVGYGIHQTSQKLAKLAKCKKLNQRYYISFLRLLELYLANRVNCHI